MRNELEGKTHTLRQRAETTVTSDGGTQTILGGLEFAAPLKLPEAWSLVIGDFASNARAALDHVAWELALRNRWRESRASTKGNPWPPPTMTFPVIRNRPTESSLRKTMRIFRPSDRKLVVAEQPFRRGNPGPETPIWILNRIRNVDIHRELHTVLPRIPPAALADLFRLVATPEGGQEFYRVQQLRNALQRVLEGASPGDAVESTVTLTAEFSPYVRFDLPGEDFHDKEVLATLRMCRDAVERIIDLFPPSY